MAGTEDIRRLALVTGANRGIGRACVEAFARSGYDVIAHARKANAEFEEAMTAIAREAQVTITPLYFDMTDSAVMKESVKPIILSSRGIDTLVNCAGVGHGVSFVRTSMAQIRQVFDVNFFAHLELTQLVIRNMARRKKGSIVNVGSISGLDLDPGNCAYGTSKAALMAFTKTLAAEIASLGIRVNCVAPGLTDTEMGHSVKDQALAKMLGRSAMSRFAKVSEIADVVVYLSSDKASFVNGQIVRVDGGAA